MLPDLHKKPISGRKIRFENCPELLYNLLALRRELANRDLMAKTVQKYLYLNDAKTPLKVIKFQKQIFLFSFEPQTERNYFLSSALGIPNGSNEKIMPLLY